MSERAQSATGLDQAAGAIPIDPIGDEVRERIQSALIAGGLLTGAAAPELTIEVPPFPLPAVPVGVTSIFADDAD